MTKTILDYIPESNDKMLVQAKIDRTLMVKVKSKMKKDKVKDYKTLLTACLKVYLEQGK